MDWLWQHFSAHPAPCTYSERDDDHHSAGVGLILKTRLKNTLIEWGLMANTQSFPSYTWCLPSYSPPNDADDEEKEAFYIRLPEETEKVPAHDLLLVTGNFNAKARNDNTSREQAMSMQGCRDAAWLRGKGSVTVNPGWLVNDSSSTPLSLFELGGGWRLVQ